MTIASTIRDVAMRRMGCLAAPARAAAPVAITPVATMPVAPGDYLHFGRVALTTLANQGDIANLGIIVGRDAVAIIAICARSPPGSAPPRSPRCASSRRRCW